MPPLGEAAHLGVLVAHPRDQDGELIIRHVQRAGARVGHAWPPPADLPDGTDVVFLLVDGRGALDAHWLAGPPPAAIVAVIGRETSSIFGLLANCSPQAVIVKPADRLEILTNLILAHNNFRYERRLLAKISKLEETLRSIRKVEKAKAILMRTRHIEEPEAYEYLRSQAMKKRVPITVVAAAVIDAHEVLG
ncbi:MAG: ANTAR domain-containing protein [Rhodospirillaceae bacterium]|nr:ANTAR domain-containing protein [Rhodospirillaceae bacterium]